jgi:hypothetical protein
MRLGAALAKRKQPSMVTRVVTSSWGHGRMCRLLACTHAASLPRTRFAVARNTGFACRGSMH